MFTSLVILIGAIVVVTVVVRRVFDTKTADKVMARNKDTDESKSIFVKKYDEINTQRFRSTFLLTGFIISLLVILYAFSWSEKEEMSGSLGDLKIDEDIEIEPPQTKQEKPPPPPPPPPKLEVVEDEEILEEDEPEIEDQEIDEDTEIEQELEEEVIEEAKIFTIVEEMPTFPGGEKKLYEFINKNLNYPQIAKESGIEGLVVVNFVVDETGSVSNVKVLRGIGGGCDEEAVRVVKRFPKWNPGKQRGKPVKVSFNLPIRLKLE